MNKLNDKHIHKGGNRPESFYSFFTSRYISKPLVPFLIKMGIKNPNIITIVSFLILLFASSLILLLKQKNLNNRIIISLLIEISFILDCADGQIARFLNKKSLFGGWLDKYLDRIGEMVLYTIIGYYSWLNFGHFIYLVLGVIIGYLFIYYSLLYAEKDSVFYEEIKISNYDLSKYFNKPKKDVEKSKKIFGKRFLKNNTLYNVISIMFFYLNIGMGERYFYPIIFILINRTDIMLVIVFILFFLRSMNVTSLLIRQIINNKIGVNLDR